MTTPEERESWPTGGGDIAVSVEGATLIRQATDEGMRALARGASQEVILAAKAEIERLTAEHVKDLTQHEDVGRGTRVWRQSTLPRDMVDDDEALGQYLDRERSALEAYVRRQGWALPPHLGVTVDNETRFEHDEMVLTMEVLIPPAGTAL